MNEELLKSWLRILNEWKSDVCIVVLCNLVLMSFLKNIDNCVNLSMKMIFFFEYQIWIKNEKRIEKRKKRKKTAKRKKQQKNEKNKRLKIIKLKKQIFEQRKQY